MPGMDLWVRKLCFPPTTIFKQVVQTLHGSLPYTTLLSRDELVNLNFVQPVGALREL